LKVSNFTSGNFIPYI